MTRTQQVLGILLVVQIALAAAIFWPDQADQNQGELLFGELSADQVVAFSVENELNKSIALNRTDGGWEISNTDGYPAKADEIEATLEKMVQVKTGRLVASNPNSFDRLSVADTNFLRRVWFEDVNGNEHIFYIGSTVGAAATHVRKAGSNEVYLTDKVSPWEYGGDARSWADVVYLEIPKEQITAMTLENASGKLTFVNLGTPEEDEWMMEGLAEGEEFNPNNLISMLTRLTSLQMVAPLGKSELPEYGFEDPSAIVTVDFESADSGMQTVVLRIGAFDPDDNNYYVHASNKEYYVKIAKYSLQDFVDRTREVFLTTEESEG